MKKQILDAEKIRIIQLQAEIVRKKGFFLAGGTAMGLLLNHRISRDLDWFTPDAFDAGKVSQLLERAGKRPVADNFSVGRWGHVPPFAGAEDACRCCPTRS